jgi:hypothetical protein
MIVEIQVVVKGGDMVAQKKQAKKKVKGKKAAPVVTGKKAKK